MYWKHFSSSKPRSYHYDNSLSKQSVSAIFPSCKTGVFNFSILTQKKVLTVFLKISPTRYFPKISDVWFLNHCLFLIYFLVTGGFIATSSPWWKNALTDWTNSFPVLPKYSNILLRALKNFLQITKICDWRWHPSFATS